MFHSPLALLILAVLVVLALPAVWMLCEVAFDLPVLGLVLVGACGAAVYILWPRVGPSLVDATLALMALTGGTLALSSLSGTWRWMWRPPATNRIPIARVRR